MIYSGYTDSFTHDKVPIFDDKKAGAVSDTRPCSAGASGATQGHVGQLEKALAASDPFGLETPPRVANAVLSNRSHHVGRGKVGARDRSRSHSSPPTSRAQVPQPQSHLHQRKGNHRATGSISSQENSIRESSHKAGHGKTKGQPHRRPVLGDVTNVHQGTPANHHLDDDSFANSTAVNTPGRKDTQDVRSHAPRGLMIELDGKPLLDAHQPSLTCQDVDDDLCLVYRTAEEFLPPQVISSPTRKIKADKVVGSGPLAHILSGPVNGLPAKAPAVYTTPLREALATFGDMFSPLSTFKTKCGSVNEEDLPRSPSRLPATPLPTINTPLKSFKFADLTGSITQFTSELAASLASHYGSEHWGQNQYEENAVARDERFDWEEAMRSLEVQCGIYGGKV